MSRIPDMGIYAIENTANGRIYVGSSESLEQRMAYHRSRIRYGFTDHRLMNEDLREYGSDAFRIVVFHRTTDPTELEYLERMWAVRLGALGADGYNGTPVRKVRRIKYEPTREALDEFEHLLLLILREFTNDYAAARALNGHGLRRPYGGIAPWDSREVAWHRERLENEGRL